MKTIIKMAAMGVVLLMTCNCAMLRSDSTAMSRLSDYNLTTAAHESGDIVLINLTW